MIPPVKNLPAFARFILSVPGVFVLSLLVLLIPFTAMQITDEVHWSLSDFVIMGLLLNGCGLMALAFIRRGNVLSRLAGVVATGSVFVLVWANLAVGLIGSGPHWGNLLYIAVLLVVVTGLVVSEFRARGMAVTCFITAALLTAIACVQLLAGQEQEWGSSRYEIIGVNGFFVALFFLSGMLFRLSAKYTNKLA